MQRALIITGLVLLAAGVLWPLIAKLGLGRLPGDVVIRRENATFYFPLVTCLLVSIALSALIWLFRR